MKDEEVAHQYAISRTYPKFESAYIARFVLREVEGAFLAGLNTGRPQWHDLREDPTDIPPRKDDTYSVEVWAKNARGHYGTAVFSYACLKDDGKYNHWIGTMPVLWTELPKVEE